MGTAWNGYRYWLADTPYAGADNQLENPCVWASHDGETWVVPPGVTNPLVPAPGSSAGFHSDPELVYDPDDARMVLYYRLAVFGGSPLAVTNIYLRALTSTDGAVWTDLGQMAEVPLTGGRLSPAIVRVGVNDWRMWVWGGTSGTVTLRTATSPLGPWSVPVNTSLGGGSLDGWHGDVIKIGGLYYMAYSPNELDQMRVATSTDGLAWTAPTSPSIMSARSGQWDSSIYRPTLQPDPEPGVMTVWYSAVSPASPGGHAIGRTRVPISAWTS